MNNLELAKGTFARRVTATGLRAAEGEEGVGGLSPTRLRHVASEEEVRRRRRRVARHAALDLRPLGGSGDEASDVPMSRDK